ncbi:rab proteins geranylgeranyltransferase component A, partial [Thraustotheca clavata]
CMRLAKHIGGNSRKGEAIRAMLRAEFRKSMHETDETVIENLKANAVRGLSNYLVLANSRFEMDDVLFESTYDVVVVGTGMVEAIVAGALARVGKKVLHLDTNDYYGSNYGSFNFNQFNEWLNAKSVHSDEADLGDNLHVPIKSTFHCTPLFQAQAGGFAPRSTSFSIDIQPKLLLSSSPLVDVLVESGVGRYLDFLALNKTCMYTPQPPRYPPVWQVPCSKTDVFKSRLNVMEKRHLMKFLQFVADYGDDDATTLNERDLAVGRALKRPQNKRNQKDEVGVDEYPVLLDALTKHFKLSPTLQNVVLHAVLLLTTPPSRELQTSPSLDKIYHFLSSIGRFAPSPFLTPMYGVAELAQAFCRLSAVYGGIYYLRAPLTNYKLQENKVEHLVTTEEGKTWKAEHFVVNAMYANPWGYQSKETCLLRGVFLVPSSMERTIIIVPPNTLHDHPYAIHVLEIDGTASVCPNEHTLIHVSTPISASTPHADMLNLINAVKAAVLDELHQVLWEAVFTVPVYEKVGEIVPSNVHVCDIHNDVSLESVFESAVDQAKAIFDSICPGEAFLPKSATAEQAEKEAAAEDEQATVILNAATNLLHTEKDDEAGAASNPTDTTSTPTYDL